MATEFEASMAEAYRKTLEHRGCVDLISEMESLLGGQWLFSTGPEPGFPLDDAVPADAMICAHGHYYWRLECPPEVSE